MDETENYHIPEERKFSELLMDAPVGMTIIKCPEMTIMMANRMALGLRNQNWEDVKGKSWYEVFPDLAAQGLDKIIHEVMKTGENYSCNQMPLKVQKDGNEYNYFIRLTYQPLKNSIGEVTAVVATGIDVTDFVLARQKIEESESKYRGLFQTMNQAFAIIRIIFDKEHRPVNYKFLETNPAFEHHTGLRNAVGKTIKELIPEIEDFWIETYGKVALTGESITFTQDALKLGRTYDVHAYKVDKFTDRVAILFTDTTERVKEEQDRLRFSKELEAKVDDRTRELARVNSDLKRFAHIASHDLREPMRKISTFNSLIKEEYGHLLPSRAHAFIARIENSIQRVKTMIEGVHDYMSGDILLSEFEAVDLNETVENVRNVLGKIIKSKNAQIIVGALPVIEAVSSLIQRLFCNLVHNALKFSQTGVPPVISINSTSIRKKGKEYARITIKDNGIGFETIYSEKIFEPFTRLNPKDYYEGAGLGLAFCRKIVKWHKGTITATGRVDEGATFYILLPYKQGKD